MRKIKIRSFSGFMLAEPIIVVAASLMLVAYPFTQPSREQARQTTCTSNQKQIALASAMFIQENDETFPIVDGSVWACIDIKGKILACPSNRNDKSFSYAYNKNLSDIPLNKINNYTEIALTADSDREDGQMAEAADVALRHRMSETTAAIISFVDGHVALVSEDNLGDVLFK